MVMNDTGLEDQLKRAVLEAPVSRYRLARISGLSEAQLSYFVNGKRSLTLPAAARLAGALGLELRPKRKRG
jgi:plasmid maintenance system antidote protein VapI